MLQFLENKSQPFKDQSDNGYVTKECLVYICYSKTKKKLTLASNFRWNCENNISLDLLAQVLQMLS